jgi:hypothetical protein
MTLVRVGVGRSLRNVVGGEETISISNQTFSPKNQLILQILFSPRMAFDSLESSDSWLLLLFKVVSHKSLSRQFCNRTYDLKTYDL